MGQQWQGYHNRWATSAGMDIGHGHRCRSVHDSENQRKVPSHVISWWSCSPGCWQVESVEWHLDEAVHCVSCWFFRWLSFVSGVGSSSQPKGKWFKIPCCHNEVVKHWHVLEQDLSEVLQMEWTFTNVSNGQLFWGARQFHKWIEWTMTIRVKVTGFVRLQTIVAGRYGNDKGMHESISCRLVCKWVRVGAFMLMHFLLSPSGCWFHTTLLPKNNENSKVH